MSFAASKLYLLDHSHRQAILVPDEDGVLSILNLTDIGSAGSVFAFCHLLEKAKSILVKPCYPTSQLSLDLLRD